MPTDCLSLFLMTESPLHAGSGSSLSDVDLPIQRETHSGLPIVYGSGVKGALRDLAKNEKGRLSPAYTAIFGPDPDEKPDEHAGQGIFQQATTVLFPVRSFGGLFVWITCPMVLLRLRRDIEMMTAGLDREEARIAANAFAGLTIPEVGVDGAALPAGSPAAVASRVYLDDQGFELDTKHSAAAGAIAAWFSANALPQSPEYQYWRGLAPKQVAIVHDEAFAHFARFATHIEFHIRIGAAGTVETGALWSEESLPPDTLLWSSIILPEVLDEKLNQKLGTQRPNQHMRDLLRNSPRFRMCGGRGTGMGLVRAEILGGNPAPSES